MTAWKALAAVGLLMLLPLGKAWGASAERVSAPPAKPVAIPSAADETTPPTPTPVSSAPAPAESAPAASASRRFIPTEQVSEDRAVAFPKDI